IANGILDKQLENVLPRLLIFTDNWWHFTINGEDQLRQRVAFALSQIFVVSLLQDSQFDKFRGFANYQDMLANHAFGNFRDLMEDVTLSPIMGDYLSMRRNEKPDASQNIRPDENYARELLQLFSIGLSQLNIDGTIQTDQSGQPITTYDQSVIEGFAHVFTGWNYGDSNFFRSNAISLNSEIIPMKAYQNFHDREEKILLNNVRLTAGQDAETDLNQALDVIFEHPNVGPFISKQLIQKLVTSNPSPDYVARVATVFNNNGNGVRGDLRAVIKAILLDTEALEANVENFGKLKEPIVRISQLFRAFDATGVDGDVRFAYLSSFAQFPYYSPSVFNFYRPDFAQPGEVAQAGLLSPEFQILTESTVTQITNRLLEIIYEVDAGQDQLSGRKTINLNYSDELALANDSTALINHLDTYLMGGTMSTTMRQELINYMDDIPISEIEARVREAVFFIVSSAQYAIQR
ncbi:MAG: DUF1800 family protein, partial [Kangiellaceae bacterium]|nr:DUF1800 family protein [Kangiellaceae bacterium]